MSSVIPTIENWSAETLENIMDEDIIFNDNSSNSNNEINNNIEKIEEIEENTPGIKMDPNLEASIMSEDFEMNESEEFPLLTLQQYQSEMQLFTSTTISTTPTSPTKEITTLQEENSNESDTSVETFTLVTKKIRRLHRYQ